MTCLGFWHRKLNIALLTLFLTQRGTEEKHGRENLHEEIKGQVLPLQRFAFILTLSFYLTQQSETKDGKKPGKTYHAAVFGDSYDKKENG